MVMSISAVLNDPIARGWMVRGSSDDYSGIRSSADDEALFPRLDSGWEEVFAEVTTWMIQLEICIVFTG